MSISSAFSTAKGALRRGACGAAMAATLFGASAAQASEFTQNECRLIDGVVREVVKTLGKDTLSLEFRQSYVNWRGAGYSCDGPPITVTTGPDIDAWNTVRVIMGGGSGPNRIDLQARGVQPIYTPASASLTANEPG